MKRYCLDTNYILRFLLKDHSKQADTVEQLLIKASEKKLSCHVSLIVQMELIYVLHSFYQEEPQRIKQIMSSLYEFLFVEFEQKTLMKNALALYEERSISIQDAYLITLSLEQKMEFASFDKKALKVFREQN
jgi:predicted nucleic-acid-binding protein